MHAARLHSGEEVVVKVQRPQVATLVRQDVAAMAWIAPYLVGRIPVAALANPPALVELFAETISEELDFRLEAQNMLDVAHVLRDAGQTLIVVPRPHPELVTQRVLVMERLDGFHADDIDGMRAAGIDTAAVLRSLMIAFLEGAMIYGVFHGDLHGGNLVVMRDGRVGLFDYGMTGRMAEPQRLAFLRMMMTGAANDVRGQLAAFRDLGALDADADLDELMRDPEGRQAGRDPTKMSSEELVSRDPGGAARTAETRRAAAEAPDALREEHAVHRRLDRPLRARRQPVRRDGARSTATSPRSTARASCATSASTRRARRSTSPARARRSASRVSPTR